MKVINKLDNLKILDLNLTSPNLHFSLAKRLLSDTPGIVFGFIPYNTTYDSTTLNCVSAINNNQSSCSVQLTSNNLVLYSGISDKIIPDDTNINYYFKIKICGQDPYTTDITNTNNTLLLSIANIPNYVVIPGKEEGKVPFDYMGGIITVRLSGCDTIYIPNTLTALADEKHYIVGLSLSHIDNTNDKIVYGKPVVIVIDKTDFDNTTSYWNRNIVRLFEIITKKTLSQDTDYELTVNFNERDEFVLTNQTELIKGLLKQINFG